MWVKQCHKDPPVITIFMWYVYHSQMGGLWHWFAHITSSYSTNPQFVDLNFILNDSYIIWHPSSWTPTAARPWHEVAFFAFGTYLKGWGGVGHVNVPCHLHTCWMLRYWRVGVGWGMLTFLVICIHVGCYVTEGLGWGGAC